MSSRTTSRRSLTTRAAANPLNLQVTREQLENENSRDEFNLKRKDMVCRSCGATGTYVLNGASKTNRTIIRCSSCHKTVSGRNLEQLLGSTAAPAAIPENINNDGMKQLYPSSSGSRHSSECPSAMSQEESTQHVTARTGGLLATNMRLTEENEKLKDQIQLNAEKQASAMQKLRTDNKDLRTQNAELNTKLDALQEQNNRLTGKIDKLSTQMAAILSKLALNDQPTPVVDLVSAPRTVPTSKPTATPAPELETPQDLLKPKVVQTAARSGPVQWTEVVKKGISSLPDNVQARFTQTMQTLKAAGFQAQRPAPRHGPAQPYNPKPIPTPVYFGNIPRGPIGALKRALQQCLPKWAVLSISFIGTSVTEILCHRPLRERLIAGMSLLRYRHLSDYDPKKAMDPTASADIHRSFKATCLRRWTAMATRSISEVCRTWYKAQSEGLLAEDKDLDKVPFIPKRTQPESPKASEQPDATNDGNSDANKAPPAEDPVSEPSPKVTEAETEPTTTTDEPTKVLDDEPKDS